MNQPKNIMQARIAISMGDYNGIGPEIILKTLSKSDLASVTPIIMGHQKVFDYYAHSLSAVDVPPILHITTADEIRENHINLLNCVDNDALDIKPGHASKHTGRSAMQAVEEGIKWCTKGITQALVTAPISKEAVNAGGYHIPGHTEFLAKKTDTDAYMMMLVHETLRVGLVTIHIPVAQIAGDVTTSAILHRLKTMHTSLKNDFDIARPKIAVLGLNPHAGDGGVIGDEEKELITPAIVKAQAQHLDASGPFPADGFFGNRKYEDFDGVLAMYHDQGLVPFKTLSFGGGVNFTAGLPFVRTSPDHGTAFDIAGQGNANPSSFGEAFSLAISLSNNRLTKEAPLHAHR